MAMDELDVRLEFAAYVAIDAHRVARFVQELNDVPPNAWCEVRHVWSTPPKAADKTVTTIVQLACDRSVADFLCQRFAKQTRHVSQGDVLLVRCRRVLLRSVVATKQRSLPVGHDTIDAKQETQRPATLPRATVVDLLDCLGDQIVEVLDAFQAFADAGDNDTPQLSMIGLVHALEKLHQHRGKQALVAEPQTLYAQPMPAKQKPLKDRSDPSPNRFAIHNVRHMLAQLVAHGAVALGTVPSRNDEPFMGYTDFIACYVASLNSSDHTSSTSNGLSSTCSYDRKRKFVCADGDVIAQTAEMCDALDETIDPVFSRSDNNGIKPARRTRRSLPQPTEDCSFGDMFLGVGELSSRDDGLVSHRSENEDRRSGPTVPSSQRQRSRVSRASSKTKATTSSGLKREPPPESLLGVPGVDLFQRENTMLARQHLASSASRVRPVKQQPPSQFTVSRRADESRVTDNNNDDNDEPIVEQAGGRTGGHFVRGRAEWEPVHDVNQAGLLPTRSRRYLDSDSVLEPTTSSDGLHADRPPSRQCHAFPTHLLDPRDFFSPSKTHDSTCGVHITPWHADDDDEEHERDDNDASSASSSSPLGPEDDGDVKQPTLGFTNQRPPSRYMVKPARSGTSSSETSSLSSTAGDDGQSRLPSRRGAAGSRNQAAVQCYHDPKTDGFLEVDESVPPPFRVEISTDVSRGAPQQRRADNERRHSLKSRRSSSFGTRSQLKHFEQQCRDDMTSNKRLDPQWFQELEPSSKRSEAAPVEGTRSRTIVQPTTTSENDAHQTASPATHQWFRSINNPFFVSPPAPTGGGALSRSYDAMDDETAIANTPLFSEGDDLMAMTQLTDLHLDDFMGDPYVHNSTAVVGITTTSASATAAPPSTKTASTSLNTSLGRDFLSLFAQH